MFISIDCYYIRRLWGNIKMNVKECVCEDLGWLHLAQVSV